MKGINQLISYLVQSASLRMRLDIAYLLRGTFWGGFQQIFGVTGGLILSYLFGHFTSKQTFGEYNLVLSYLSMLTFFSLPGLDTALISSVGRGFDRSFVLATKTKIKFSILGSVVLLVIGVYFTIYRLPDLAVTIFLSALFFPFVNGFSNYPAFLTGKRKFRELALLSTGASFFFLLLHALGIVWLNTTFILVLAYLLARTFSDLTGFLYSRRYINSSNLDPGLVGYGKFLSWLGILPWISGHIGSITLAHMLGAEALAVYAVATRFLVAIQKNFVVFYKPVTAKLAKQMPYEHWSSLKTHWTKLLVLGIGLAAILYFLTPALISFFFTERYQEAILYGRLLSMALIPMPLTWALTDVLVYQKKRQVQVVISVIPHITKIVLYFIFIPKFGILALVAILLLERFTDPLIPLLAIVKDRHKNLK